MLKQTWDDLGMFDPLAPTVLVPSCATCKLVYCGGLLFVDMTCRVDRGPPIAVGTRNIGNGRGLDLFET